MITTVIIVILAILGISAGLFLRTRHNRIARQKQILIEEQQNKMPVFRPQLKHKTDSPLYTLPEITSDDASEYGDVDMLGVDRKYVMY